VSRARAGLLLFASVSLLYAPSLDNEFVYDDWEVIVAQVPWTRARDAARVFVEPHGLPQSQLPYYRPIPRATLLAQKTLTGDAPAPFHAANALLMGAIAVAAWWLVRAPVFGLGAGAALWVAAAFAIHPIASECVYPAASGRESAVPALFTLVSLGAWVRAGAKPRALATLAYAAALWSKELAITVPILMALADVLGVSADAPGRHLRVWIRRFAPVVAVTALYLAVRTFVLPNWSAGAREPSQLLAALAAHPFGPLQSLLYFVQMTVAPSAWLRYEPPLDAWLVPWRAVAAVVFALAIAAMALARPPRHVALFWLGWIPIAMALHLNVLPLEVPFAERYLFVSSLGAFVLVALAADHAARWIPRRALSVAGVAALAGLASLTLLRDRPYRDDLAFAAQWVAASPRHANAHASHGAALARAGRDAEAVRALEIAVALDPRLASAHYNLGVLHGRNGRIDASIESFRETLRWWSGDPDAHYALGVLLGQRGERDAALAHLREALRLRPAFPEAVTALRRVESGS
jgi:tetratricopeptide (TPR) repeat protein